MMIDLKNKTIAVTGGEGFLGHHLVPLLNSICSNTYVVSHKDYNLLNSRDVTYMYSDFTPDIIIHLAANVGGIQYNQANPGKLFYENTQMGINLINYAVSYKRLEKLVCLGTVCMYPRIPPNIPFEETDIWEGYPEGTNAPYGIAKKSLLVMCQSYRKQYGLNSIFLIPINLFGEFDSFDDKRAHVIPMLIKKFLKAKQDNLPEVEIWGTGNATREFMYAGDAAKVIVKATEVYNKPEPLNIGVGQEIAIMSLATTIANIIGYHPLMVFNSSMPDGQPRRVLDITNMITELKYTDKFTSLEDGLGRTISWYKENKQ